MKLVIHIGNHKAGSSTIQTGLLDNRETLLKKGVLYPKIALNTCAHHNLPFSMIGQASGFKSKEKPKSLVLYRDEIINEATRYKADIVVVSSEEFMKFKAKDISEFSRFTNLFDSVEVVVYLRNHIDLIESAYKFRILWEATSETISFKQHLQENLISDYHDYDKRIEPWLMLHNNLTVVVKDFQSEIKKGLLANFIKGIGVTDDLELTTSDAVINSSLTRLGTLLLRQNNRKPIYDRDKLIEKIRFMELQNPMLKKELLYTPEQFNQTVERFYRCNQNLQDCFDIVLNQSINRLDTSSCLGESYTDMDKLRLSESKFSQPHVI